MYDLRYPDYRDFDGVSVNLQMLYWITVTVLHSEDLVSIEQEYQDLLAHQARALATGVPWNHMSREELDHYKEIQKALVEKHPRYRSLPLVNCITEDQLREKLGAEEVLYQVVIGEIWSASMIVTRSQIIFDIARIGRKAVARHVRTISEYILSMPHSNLSMDEFSNSTDVLSKQLFGTLTEYLKKNKVNRVYLCKDVDLGMFSSSLIRMEADWLVERINSIHNIISPVELMRDTMATEPKCDVRSFLFGPTADRAISRISGWQKRRDISEILVIDTLDISRPRDEIQRLRSVGPYVAFIAGHGVHDVNESGGAILIKGKNELISARDLNPILMTCECAIVLSCSGGQPVLSRPESREGIWAGIVGTGLKSALLCTWDVDAEAALGMIEYLLRFERSKFSAALSDVKRAMIGSKDYSNPYFWAGIEYWGSV